MAFIVHNHRTVFARADFSIAGRNYGLMRRAFNWLIAELEAFARQVQEEEARMATAALTRALGD